MESQNFLNNKELKLEIMNHPKMIEFEVRKMYSIEILKKINEEAEKRELEELNELKRKLKAKDKVRRNG